MINLQTALSKSHTVAVSSYVFNEGRPEHWSVSVNVRPSWKQQKHLWMCIWLMASSQNAVLIITSVNGSCFFQLW